MQSTLQAIERSRSLRLRVVACGMHTLTSHGRTAGSIEAAGLSVDAVVPWQATTTPHGMAQQTGSTIAALSKRLKRLRTQIVLVVGDRVEALAAAVAGHLSGLVVAHVHGGDRAMGQADDSIRHAITKLSHLHFAVTADSAARIARLGEPRWRIRTVGTPGLDGIRSISARWAAIAGLVPADARRPRGYALLVLHPTEPDPAVEMARAGWALQAVLSAGVPGCVIVHPNNDPGSVGIMRAWSHVRDRRVVAYRNLAREEFLGLLRDAAMLVGNSSAGIIEAGAFGTPVVDIGPRQRGRLRGPNVRNVPWRIEAIRHAVATAWRSGRPRRYSPATHPWGAGRGAGRKIAQTLASIQIDTRLLRKLIAY